MVSAGTLMVFGVVAVALIWKRVVKRGAPLGVNAKPLGMLFLITAASVGEQAGSSSVQCACCLGACRSSSTPGTVPS